MKSVPLSDFMDQFLELILFCAKDTQNNSSAKLHYNVNVVTLREMLTQILLNEKKTVQLWHITWSQPREKKYSFMILHMKRECMHTNIYIFFTTESGSHVGKNVMNCLDTKILHELEYSIYEKRKCFKELNLSDDDRIIRYDFVVSCPTIYGTL